MCYYGCIKDPVLLNLHTTSLLHCRPSFKCQRQTWCGLDLQPFSRGLTSLYQRSGFTAPAAGSQGIMGGGSLLIYALPGVQPVRFGSPHRYFCLSCKIRSQIFMTSSHAGFDLASDSQAFLSLPCTSHTPSTGLLGMFIVTTKTMEIPIQRYKMHPPQSSRHFEKSSDI